MNLISPPQQKREPILNLPPIIVVMLAVVLGVHALREVLLESTDLWVILRFAFIPIRYSGLAEAASVFPPDDPARWWSIVTYSLLHGDWTHVLVNALWLAAFGSPVAWRFGIWRFVLFWIITAACGAAAHQIAHAGEVVPMVGASASISGFTAAALRFAFQSGVFAGVRPASQAAFSAPAEPLLRCLSDPRILAFVLVWFAMNFLFGVGGIVLPGNQPSIAWEAHIGGFLAGLILFAVIDPVRSR